ncbi:hypothetical protein [Sphingomonas sp. PB4P5]|uniref:hypothetical protein n=1 Tax=Parasphingomonas puruogangriensis TaxID=3096155 RepID=UPI002FC58D20
MGEAKQRRLDAVPTVYHHTSTLRTNLLWMSGVIEVEGKGGAALHPNFGKIELNANLRRRMNDFPPLAWFTTQVSVPNCILKAGIQFYDKTTGEPRDLPVDPRLPNAVALQRVAIGFPIADIPVLPWKDHPGYATTEGVDLNESARDAGDSPDDWYVSDVPVDLLAASEFWAARSIMNPKMVRQPDYLPDLKRMVRACRDTPGVFIPPSWLTPAQAAALAKRMGVETRSASEPLN